MNCDEAFLHEEDAEARAHIESCASCRDRAAALRAAGQSLSRLAQRSARPLSPDVRARVVASLPAAPPRGQRWARRFLVAAVVFAAAALSQHFSQPTTTAPTTVERRGTKPPEAIMHAAKDELLDAETSRAGVAACASIDPGFFADARDVRELADHLAAVQAITSAEYDTCLAAIAAPITSEQHVALMKRLSARAQAAAPTGR